MRRFAHPPSVLVAIGVVTIGVGTMLRWPALGTTRQHGFRMAESLANAGRVLDLPTVRVVAGLWYLIPLSAGFALVAVAIDRAVAWIIALLLLLASAAASIAALWAADRVHIPTAGSGPPTAIVGSLIGAAGAVVGLVHRAHAHRTVRAVP